MKKIPDKSIDLVVTDPPYLIENKGSGLYKKKERPYTKQIENIKDGYSTLVLDELCRVMKKINIYLFCSQKQILPLLKYFVEGKKCNYNLLTWHKNNPVPACGNKYLTDTEFILFFREKGVKIGGEFKSKFTYYVTPINKADKKKFEHPTIKPLFIVQNLIKNSSQEGDLVLDPFIGSGTTAVACASLKRNYLGFEIEEKYFNTAKRRLEDVRVFEHTNHIKKWDWLSKHPNENEEAWDDKYKPSALDYACQYSTKLSSDPCAMCPFENSKEDNCMAGKYLIWKHEENLKIRAKLAEQIRDLSVREGVICV